MTNNAWNSPYPSTKGQIIVGDGSGAPSLLTVGDDDQVLTADSGEATGVKWATPSAGSGALVLLETKSATTSASLNFVTGISSTYTNYLILLTAMILDTDNTSLFIKLSTDGGSTWLGGTSYRFGVAGYSGTTGSAGGNFGSTGTSSWQLIQPQDSAAATGAFGTLNIMNLTAGIRPGMLSNIHFFFDSGTDAPHISFGGFEYTSNITANGIQLLPGTGNITSGTASLYGYTK